MPPTDTQSAVPTDLLFTGFVHGRCILAVETIAWELLEDISDLDVDKYDPFLDAERFLDSIDDLRRRYKTHLKHVCELLPEEDIVEYRVAAKRIETIFDDCREKLLMLKCDPVIVLDEKTIEIIEEVPEFNGKISDWAKFQVKFRKRVLENVELCEAEKLEVFNLKVSGELRRRLTNSASIDVLWKALCTKFDQNAIRYHVKELFANKKVSKRMTSEELTTIVESSEEHVQALEYLGYVTNPFSNLLLGHLLKSQTSSDFQNDLDKLDRLPTWASIKSILLKSAASRKLQKHQQNVSADTRCFYCHRSHILRLCHKFRNLPFEQRFKIVVRDAKICHICFSSSHRGRMCNTMVNCKHCGGAHNTTLHPEDDDEEKIAVLNKLMV